MEDKLQDLLSAIGYPSDLRQLPEEQLPDVCEAIRRFIIDQISVHPGHFASSRIFPFSRMVPGHSYLYSYILIIH